MLRISLLPGHNYQGGMELSDPFLWPAGMRIIHTGAGHDTSLEALDIVQSVHEAVAGSSYGSVGWSNFMTSLRSCHCPEDFQTPLTASHQKP